MLTRDEIIEKGECKIRVKRQGVFQQLTFNVVWVESPLGEYPALQTDKEIDLAEVIRVAEEYNLPVRAKNGNAFPTGKAVKDFVEEFKEWVIHIYIRMKERTSVAG